MAQFGNGTESAAYNEKSNVRTAICGDSLSENQNCVKPILRKKIRFF